MQAVTGVDSSFEKFLADKASLLEAPIGANLELIPVCNMDCRMCYVRTDMKEVSSLGGLLDKSFWIHLGDELRTNGTLFVLFTGGEPLLYPYFKEVYKYYNELGFVITVNTNGTLIDDSWVEFFSEYPPRRLNITLYGKDNDTYSQLCGNPKGYDQISNGIRLLKDRNIPFRLNCSLTKYNYQQMKELYQIAKDWDVPIEMAYYLMPPKRKVTHSATQYIAQANREMIFPLSSKTDVVNMFVNSRLSPEEAADAAYFIFTVDLSQEEERDYIYKKIAEVEKYISDKEYIRGYRCRAGNSSVWVNWDGTMTSCGMMGDKEYSLKEEPFSVLWEQLKERTKQVELSPKCINCSLKPLCPSCAAAEYTENDSFGKEPEYLCRFASAFYELLKRKATAI